MNLIFAGYETNEDGEKLFELMNKWFIYNNFKFILTKPKFSQKSFYESIGYINVEKESYFIKML